MMKKKILFLFVIVSLFFFNSCKKELEIPTWDIDLIFPIANTEINIYNILKDSIISLEVDNDNFISLVYEKNLIDIKLDSLININAIVGETSTKLDSLKFASIIIRDTTTLGSLLNNLPFGTTLFPNGSLTTIPNLPNIISNDTVIIDASDYFETMELITGNLNLTVRNDFPTDLSNISFTLINAINQNIIGSFSYPLIPSNTLQTQTISIAGQTIDKDILAILNNVDINESNGNVTLDYQDAIKTKLVLENIKISEATAYFPDQEISQKLQEHTFNLNGAQIHEIGIKEGSVSIFALSTIPDSGRIIFNIPSLKKNGIEFTTENIVPPSINGEFTRFDFDFNNYTLDLTGKDNRIGGDTINTIYTEFFSYIDSTGELITLNQSDSFYYYTVFNIVPEYAKGFLGRDTISIGPENTTFNQFNEILSGDLDLEEVMLELSINNYVGAPSNLTFFELNSENSFSGDIMSIGTDLNTGNYILDNKYILNSAVLVNNNFLNILNSNLSIQTEANELIDILPDKLNFAAEFILNNDNLIDLNQFIYTEKTLEAQLKINLPLSLIANKICLVDTIKFDNSNNLKFTNIYLNIENSFPLEAKIHMTTIDNNNNIDTIINNYVIASAITDENNIVISNCNSLIEINNIDFTNISNIILKSELSTENINSFTKIYSDYNIKLNMSGRIKQTIGN
tara:strand:- start:1518 stop:3572 length:2055 start_codon:yes stop_codon:yes gene_type:complete